MKVLRRRPKLGKPRPAGAYIERLTIVPHNRPAEDYWVVYKKDPNDEGTLELARHKWAPHTKATLEKAYGVQQTGR